MTRAHFVATRPVCTQLQRVAEQKAPVPAQLPVADTTAWGAHHPPYRHSLKKADLWAWELSLGCTSALPAEGIRHCHSSAPGLSSLYSKGGCPLEALTLRNPFGWGGGGRGQRRIVKKKSLDKGGALTPSQCNLLGSVLFNANTRQLTINSLKHKHIKSTGDSDLRLSFLLHHGTSTNPHPKSPRQWACHHSVGPTQEGAPHHKGAMSPSSTCSVTIDSDSPMPRQPGTDWLFSIGPSSSLTSPPSPGTALCWPRQF